MLYGVFTAVTIVGIVVLALLRMPSKNQLLESPTSAPDEPELTQLETFSKFPSSDYSRYRVDVPPSGDEAHVVGLGRLYVHRHRAQLLERHLPDNDCADEKIHLQHL